MPSGTKDGANLEDQDEIGDLSVIQRRLRPYAGLYLSREGGRTTDESLSPFSIKSGQERAAAAEDTASCCSIPLLRPRRAIAERESESGHVREIPPCFSHCERERERPFPQRDYPCRNRGGTRGADGWIWSSGFGQMSAKPECRAGPF